MVWLIQNGVDDVDGASISVLFECLHGILSD